MKTVLFLAAAILASGASFADVKANYTKHCTKCHGADGRGQTKMGKQSGAKDYTDPKVLEKMDEARAMKILKEGLVENGKEKKKGFAGKLSEAEMKELVAHMRTFKK